MIQLIVVLLVLLQLQIKVLLQKKNKKGEITDTPKNTYDEKTNEKMLDLSYLFLHIILDALSFNSNRSLLL